MVHVFKRLNNYFLYDVESGGFHQVSYLVFLLAKERFENVKADLKGFTSAEINDAKDEIEELIKKGYLDAKAPINVHKKTNRGLKAMCLHICHECNLKCAYCFANEGTYNAERGFMSKEVGFAAVDYLISASQGRKNLEIDFFGGEPLLDFKVVKDIVYYAESLGEKHNKSFKFTLTTNCVLLDEEKLAFLNKHIFNVVLSIDGRKQVHNLLRKTKDGRGSYDAVLKNIKRFISERGEKSYYARGTFTNKNLDFLQDVKSLYENGIEQISIEPVVLEPGHALEIKPMHLQDIEKEYEKLALYILGLNESGKYINFFHFYLDLDNSPCFAKRITGCGAGCDYAAVTPKGDIYPCHQFVSDKRFLMGNVFDGVSDNGEKVSNEFLNVSVLSKENCRGCFAKYHCGGGCNANAFNMNGSLNVPYKLGCEIFKTRLEIALALYALTHARSEQLLPEVAKA
jgi:uncharacterized protein